MSYSHTKKALMSGILASLCVMQCTDATTHSYQRTSEAEELAMCQIDHITPNVGSIAALIGGWKVAGLYLDRFAKQAPSEEYLVDSFMDEAGYASTGQIYSVKVAKILAALGCAWATRTFAYTVVNHKKWPILVVHILHGQIDDYCVFSSLRKELLSLNRLSGAGTTVDIIMQSGVRECLDHILNRYKHVIQAEIDILQKYGSRICDDATIAMLDALERDFTAISKGSVLHRDDVLTITRGGLTSCRRDFQKLMANSEQMLPFVGHYESVISPLSALYIETENVKRLVQYGYVTDEVIDKAREINVQVLQLCNSFDAALTIQEQEFYKAYKHCARISKGYQLYDCVEALCMYATSRVAGVFGK